MVLGKPAMWKRPLLPSESGVVGAGPWGPVPGKYRSKLPKGRGRKPAAVAAAMSSCEIGPKGKAPMCG